MVESRARPLSVDGGASSSRKRQKTEHIEAHFATNLLEQTSVNRLHDAYAKSGPYKHVVVEKLFQDDLVEKVKNECIGELSFTEKETDIYKVLQTGDLASLSYLPEEEVSRLQNLLTFRDALYSASFRSFVRKVTGCGPLSGTKQDMSVNSYKKGCHLLNHDDVIGSRRVSYIFYMPLPVSQEWKKEWGGALELYPVKEGASGINEPECIPSKVIPPSWNQFIFFEVQPGHSFHSVEEVVVDEGGNERQRLSISGWFHKAQEGEEDYEAEAQHNAKSSLEQLTKASTDFVLYSDSAKIPIPDEALDPQHLIYLATYISPIYLDLRTLPQLTARFVEESSLQLHHFLRKPIADRLLQALLQREKEDGIDGEIRKEAMTPHTAGADSKGWTLRGPPHKHRFCSLPTSISPQDREKAHEFLTSINLKDDTSSEEILQHLQDHLFPSAAFRAWLSVVARVIPLGHHVETRRFRPGLDYTLAMGDETETRLDVVLGLTPEVSEKSVAAHKVKPSTQSNDKGKGNDVSTEDEEDEDGLEGWDRGEWGGWECYLAHTEGDDDPAVYRSAPSRSKKQTNGGSWSLTLNVDDKRVPDDGPKFDLEANGDDAVEVEENDDEDNDDEDDDADGILLTAQPGFNRLLLVLRDPGVLRFVKYVSASAPGSRWDVCGEYEIGMIDSDDEEEEENVEGPSTSEDE